MSLNIDQLAKCVKTMELSLQHLQNAQPEDIEYEVFRNAVIKSFELTLEVSGKLLRKALKAYVGNPRQIDALNYKEVLRYAAKHGLLNIEAVERWFVYRDNCNDTAHDYGVAFAQETLKLIPSFLKDAYALKETLQEKLG